MRSVLTYNAMRQQVSLPQLGLLVPGSTVRSMAPSPHKLPAHNAQRAHLRQQDRALAGTDSRWRAAATVAASAADSPAWTKAKQQQVARDRGVGQTSESAGSQHALIEIASDHQDTSHLDSLSSEQRNAVAAPLDRHTRCAAYPLP